MFMCVFTSLGGSLVVGQGYQPYDVPLMEWDWEDLAISNDIIGVVMESLKYVSSPTCTTLLMRIY